MVLGSVSLGRIVFTQRAMPAIVAEAPGPDVIPDPPRLQRQGHNCIVILPGPSAATIPPSSLGIATRP